MALPQKHRLRRRQDFQTVYRMGSHHASSNLVVRALAIGTTQPRFPRSASVTSPHLRGTANPSPDLPLDSLASPSDATHPTRIGISVSQKVVGKRAVIRNRVKRRIRSACQQLLPELPGGWLLVIVVRSGAVQCESAQFLRELKQLLTEADILHGHS